jgi:hypothetical protein
VSDVEATAEITAAAVILRFRLYAEIQLDEMVEESGTRLAISNGRKVVI